MLLGIGLVAQAAQASVTFSDSNPVTAAAGGNWNPVASSAGGLYVLSIGNSYSFYDTTVAPYTNNEMVLGFTHSEVANVYWGVGARHTTSFDPASIGGVGSIDYSQNARKGSLDGVAQALLLIQNGKYYRTAFNVIPPSSSSPSLLFTGTGLTASMFGEFNGTSYGYAIPADGRANFSSNPDFSATGAPIQFGWLGHFQSGAGGYGTTDASLPATSLASSGSSPAAYLLTTDYSITFNPVPEPSSAAMLLGCCLVPALRRRRR
jgi:hypothetical protein